MNAGKFRDRPRFRASGKRGLSLFSKGFTYLALLIVIAVGGAVLAAIGQLTSHAQQREKEAELIFAGHQFRQAIAAYYERSPGGAKRYPQKLEDLLEDRRYPNVQRYLRKLYRDPMSGRADWGVVEAPSGGIMGVYSQSAEPPVKSGNFSKADETLVGATRYSDWKFVYSPAGLAVSQPGNTK
jgi:type II secretory pathway pseudopilin PulG